MSKCKTKTISECMHCDLNYDGKCNLDDSSYNRAFKDFYSECERVSDYGAFSVLAMMELKDILVKLIK